MKKSRFTEEQIVLALMQAGLGTSVSDVCRKLGISDATFTRGVRNTAEFPLLNSNMRVHVMLRREGWRDNHKMIYRIYSEQGLSLRLNRPRRNKSA